MKTIDSMRELFFNKIQYCLKNYELSEVHEIKALIQICESDEFKSFCEHLDSCKSFKDIDVSKIKGFPSFEDFIKEYTQEDEKEEPIRKPFGILDSPGPVGIKREEEFFNTFLNKEIPCIVNNGPDENIAIGYSANFKENAEVELFFNKNNDDIYHAVKMGVELKISSERELSIMQLKRGINNVYHMNFLSLSSLERDILINSDGEEFKYVIDRLINRIEDYKNRVKDDKND